MGKVEKMIKDDRHRPRFPSQKVRDARGRSRSPPPRSTREARPKGESSFNYEEMARRYKEVWQESVDKEVRPSDRVGESEHKKMMAELRAAKKHAPRYTKALHGLVDTAEENLYLSRLRRDSHRDHTRRHAEEEHAIVGSLIRARDAIEFDVIKLNENQAEQF